MEFDRQLRKAKSFGEIFDIVRKAVFYYCGKDQAGLMLGVSDLDAGSNKFIGAFYTLHGNMIIINKRPLERITQTNPRIYNPYIFHVLLHEYLHSLGIMDEASVRQMTYEISLRYFGAEHQATKLAQNIEMFMPNLVYPSEDFQMPENNNIDFVLGFDRKNTDYIM